MQAALGQPASVRMEQIANSHDPSQTDQIHTLTYPGFVIRLYDAVAFKKRKGTGLLLGANYLIPWT